MICWWPVAIGILQGFRNPQQQGKDEGKRTTSKGHLATLGPTTAEEKDFLEAEKACPGRRQFPAGTHKPRRAGDTDVSPAVQWWPFPIAERDSFGVIAKLASMSSPS